MVSVTAVSAPSPLAGRAEGWRGRLALSLAPLAGRTRVVRRRHSGPLLVQRPFYPEPPVCHLYLLHPPGGVVGGDVLELDVELREGAAALLTTPAAGKFYRSAGATARQSQRLRVADGATLEWLPQETILFDGARAVTETRVELTGAARFLGWEILCLGRPASGEDYRRGALTQRFDIRRDGRPLWLERLELDPAGELRQARWGLAGAGVSATLVCVSDDPALVERVRAAAGTPAHGDLFTVTQLSQVLVCRYLGGCAQRARRHLLAAWRVLRPAVLGRPAETPRIWHT